MKRLPLILLACVIYLLPISSVQAENFSNFALTTLSNSIGSGDTTLTIASTANFPLTAPFRLVIQDTATSTPEIVYVTGVAGSTYTVTRGYEGTSQTAHTAGAQVAQFVTAGVISNLYSSVSSALQAGNNLSDLANAANARFNLGLVLGTNVEAWSAVLDAVSASQTQNLVLASPSSGSGNMAPRALVGSDLPNPAANSKGGVQSLAATAHQWLNSISTSGVPSASQPAASDISGLAASATTDTTNASNIASGTLAAARLPNPSPTTLGGVESVAPITHNFLTGVSTAGSYSQAQPAASDISGLAASATTDTTNAGNITAGNLSVSRLNGGTAASSSTFWRGDGTWAGVVTSPSGTSGQLQYNNAGAFGAFTASGDCTITPSTGVVMCTKTNGANFAPSATVDTTNAANIASGILPQGRLPNPSASALGGVQSIAAVAHNFLTGISTSGVPAQAQPSASDISGLAASATTDTTSASNISSGTLPAGRLPAPTASSLGGTQSIAAVSHNFLTAISTSGVPSQAQPTAGDISQPADRTVTASSDPIVSTDNGRVLNFQSLAGTAESLSAATTAGFGQGFAFGMNNNGGGSVTLTPPANTFIGNNASFLIPQGTGAWLRSDSVNYQIDLASCSACAYNPVFSTGTFSSSLDPRFTVTNATAGQCSYYNSSGILSFTGAGLCAGRYDYNPGTLALNGTAVETASSNLVPYANTMIGGNWSGSSATITANAAVGPDGTTDATSMTATGTSSGNNSVYNVPTVSGTVYIGSVYVKYVNQAWINVYVYDTANSGCYFNLQTVATTAIGNASNCSMQPVANGYYRVSFMNTATVTGTTSFYTRFATASGNNFSSNVGDKYYVYGADLEPQSTALNTLPTSYIPNATGSTVTRAADLFKPTNAYFASSTNGTACVGFKTLQNLTGSYVLADTVQERALIDFASASSFGSYDGTNSANYSLAPAAAGTLNKVCVSYSGTSSVAAVNGTAGTAQTFAGSYGLSGLNFFNDYAGAHPTIGWVQSFKFYSPALSGTALTSAAQ